MTASICAFGGIALGLAVPLEQAQMGWNPGRRALSVGMRLESLAKARMFLNQFPLHTEGCTAAVRAKLCNMGVPRTQLTWFGDVGSGLL